MSTAASRTRRSSSRSSSRSATGFPCASGTSRRSRTAKRTPSGPPAKDGVPTVVLSVRKQSGTNTVAVIDAIKDRLAEIAPQLPAGYSTEIVRDQSQFIKAAVDTVQEHLVLGGFLAALVVLLFLGNLRSTLIAAIAIPTSIVSTYALMYAMGFTLNVLTLLALTLAVGIVIDDAIVVLENIFRFIEEKQVAAVPGGDRRDEGDRPRRPRDDALARGGLPAGRVHGRHRRAVHELLRPHDGVRDPRLAPRLLLAHADAVGAVPEEEGRKERKDRKRRRIPWKERERGRRQGAPRSGGAWAFRRRDLQVPGVLRDHRPHVRRDAPVVHGAPLGGRPDLRPRSSSRSRFSSRPSRRTSSPTTTSRSSRSTSARPRARRSRRRRSSATASARTSRRLPGVEYTLLTVGGDDAKTPNLGSVYVKLVDADKRKHPADGRSWTASARKSSRTTRTGSSARTSPT